MKTTPWLVHRSCELRLRDDARCPAFEARPHLKHIWGFDRRPRNQHVGGRRAPSLPRSYMGLATPSYFGCFSAKSVACCEFMKNHIMKRPTFAD